MTWTKFFASDYFLGLLTGLSLGFVIGGLCYLPRRKPAARSDSPSFRELTPMQRLVLAMKLAEAGVSLKPAPAADTAATAQEKK